MPSWRHALPSDIEGLVKVADNVHPDLPESDDVFQERIILFPEGCLILTGDDGEVCGYAISHPIRHEEPPSLDKLLREIPPEANQYYIHDLAILPKMRGKGLAAEALRILLQVAEAYPSACLISVYGTTSFWSKFGFTAEPISDALTKKLEEYGEDATFMSRTRKGTSG
ncbi:acyl-CoA N-acyltransferase [Stachybotrys elegans]|uniref:Acyl-CoA N-acyltransferase n=1 Tax=Stachybotrys elegans TaxID=80388 RepID=A0A8K0WK66_9HYPO|nr:acyl-CoA N-acyltransferase [Stachybotrys elegans]